MQKDNIVNIGKTKNIGILMPTLDRPQMVQRALNYYCRSGFKGTVYLGDSSKQFRNEMLNISERFSNSNKLKVKYYFLCPEEYSSATTFKYLVETSDEPYLCYAGDDDFQVTESLNHCASFLENNDDYSGCHGFRLEFELDSFNEITNVRKPKDAFLDTDIILKRIFGYLKNSLSPQYYLFRRSAFERAYRDVVKVETRFILEEVLPCILLCSSGKIRYLDNPQVFFQIYSPVCDPRTLSFNRQTIFDIMRTKDFDKSIKIAARSIQDQIKAVGSEKEAEMMVYYHLGLIVNEQMNNHIKVYFKKNRMEEENIDKQNLQFPFVNRDYSFKRLLFKIFPLLFMPFKRKNRLFENEKYKKLVAMALLEADQ